MVSRDTIDTDYAAHRQRFLAEQGYAYHIVDADDLLGPAVPGTTEPETTRETPHDRPDRPRTARGAANDEVDELDELAELEPWEEILEEWEYLGWLDVLPAGLMAITGAFDGPTTRPAGLRQGGGGHARRRGADPARR